MPRITVVGGTYRERSDDPYLDRLYGSGMRAAGILSSLGDDARLVTCVDAAAWREAQAVSAALDVEIDARSRDQPIAFEYETPISPARRVGEARVEPLVADSKVVLGFGMVECDWHATAETLVIDPQHAPVARLLESCDASRVAVILNEHEAMGQTGERDPRAAAEALLSLGVDVIVVKQGALGGLVATSARLDTFGAVPTATVQPLGSGDAFSAGFTHRWITGPEEPLEAAEFGSRVAAGHSITGVPQIDQSVLAGLPAALAFAGQGRPRVYLAGPFFSVAERRAVRMLRATLQHIGAEVLSPFDDVGRGGDEVAEADLEGLTTCQAMLALLDGADPGTLFEVGWAVHAGIPVIALAENDSDHAWTMVRGTGATVVSDLSTALYAAVWAAIEATTPASPT